MSFIVVPPGRLPKGVKGFILRQDNWNDYSFQTQYQLFWGGEDDAPELIGDVKILRRGQTAADGFQLQVGTLLGLEPEFCSVGQSLDYYERLAALGPEHRDAALNGLRDIVIDEDNAKGFDGEAGWSTSLFRYISSNDDFLALAKSLMTRNYVALAHVDLRISFAASGWEEPLVLDFSVPPSKLDFPFHSTAVSIPGRVAVLVGRNGSGKSTILARLARVVHASGSDRQHPEMTKLGLLNPPGIGFTRIVAISYSAFDSFAPPGMTLDERRKVASEIRSGTGRYMFCGLRDIAREMEEVVATQAALDDGIYLERLPSNRIKSLDQITGEFVSAIERIKNANRVDLLAKASAPLFRDPSLYRGGEDGIARFLGDEVASQFHDLSTGHKIVLHVIASVVSYAERKSIILFDEPETHLHPPLLAALMHGLRLAVEALDSFAVVATHSPVVVQETMARHVSKIVRVGGAGHIMPVEIETFGESVGAITNEVFALSGSAADYHVVLRALAETYNSTEEIDELFDRGLSNQARAFVMALLARSSEGAG